MSAAGTVARPGPRNDITDVAGLLVGNAQDARLKSGATVVLGERPFTASCAVAGGAPGTRETDFLEPDKSVAQADALVLAGGSAFGLDAAAGVMAGLREAGRGFPVREARVPLVPAAILFDLLNGGAKDWKESPYPALGRAALDAAGRTLDLGSQGAGTGATTATLKGGLGSASLVLPDGITVAALVAVNAMGSATTPGERHFWAAPFEIDGEFGGLGPDPRSGLGRDVGREPREPDASAERANTTIAVVATDAALTKSQAKRVAVAAHDGIARAIVPAHAPGDGDLVFAAATGIAPAAAGGETGVEAFRALGRICDAAALCLARAIARGVYLATPEPGDPLPCWRDVKS